MVKGRFESRLKVVLTCTLLSHIQEENDVGEFYLSLDKDPQQEEFLQGRMQGNPYPSSSPGLGPLMRDVKNKICTGQWIISILNIMSSDVIGCYDESSHITTVF